MHFGKSAAYRLLRLCCRQQLTRRPHSQHSSPSIIDLNSEIIYYDLETTGLNPSNKHKGIEILQLGAISDRGGVEFHQYILPTKPISYHATKVHGLSLKNQEGVLDMNSLYIREDGVSRRVEAVDKQTGLKRFVKWLGGFEAGVTLAGYNSHNYDDWVLCHQMQGVIGGDHMQGVLGGDDLGIRGLVDVSKIVRPLLREKLRTRKWNLGFAVTNLLNRSQGAAHGALSDAKDVRDLLIEIASKRNETTKNVLNESKEAFRDFESVWTVCFNMVKDDEIVNNSTKELIDDSIWNEANKHINRVRYKPRIFHGFLKTENNVQNEGTKSVSSDLKSTTQNKCFSERRTVVPFGF